MDMDDLSILLKFFSVTNTENFLLDRSISKSLLDVDWQNKTFLPILPHGHVFSDLHWEFKIVTLVNTRIKKVSGEESILSKSSEQLGLQKQSGPFVKLAQDLDTKTCHFAHHLLKLGKLMTNYKKNGVNHQVEPFSRGHLNGIN